MILPIPQDRDNQELHGVAETSSLSQEGVEDILDSDDTYGKGKRIRQTFSQ